MKREVFAIHKEIANIINKDMCTYRYCVLLFRNKISILDLKNIASNRNLLKILSRFLSEYRCELMLANTTVYIEEKIQNIADFEEKEIHLQQIGFTNKEVL